MNLIDLFFGIILLVNKVPVMGSFEQVHQILLYASLLNKLKLKLMFVMFVINVLK